jgi:putative membrane protein
MSATLALAAADPTLLAAAHGWQGGPPFFVFPIFFVLFWAAVIVLFVTLRRGSWRARSDARSVLADRFARGDIDAEEYRARLSELSRK